MDITLIKILLFAFPGILGHQLYNNINGVSENRKDWEGLISVFVFSVASYTVLDFFVKILPDKLLNILGLQNCTFDNLLIALNPSEGLTFKFEQMFALSLISIFITYIATFFINKKIFNHLAVKLKLTKRVGGEDVWEVFHDTYSEWVVVRDFSKNLVYFGYISYFSDVSKKHELIMTEVSVYDENSKLLYEVDVLYLSREHSELDIEIHDQTKEELIVKE